MRILMIRCLVMCLVWTALPAAAGEWLEIRVINRDTGAALDMYSHRGQTFIAGQPRQRYAIALANRTDERILAVLSVDGVNVVSGETASPSQTGYVLDPYQQVEILGWRKSEQEIAQFYFTSLPDSYAARTHRPDNVGVIGVAVFREKARPAPPPPVIGNQYGDHYPSRDAARADGRMTEQAAPAAAAPPAKRERIGTGHGEREYAPVTQTNFVRASRAPAEIIALRYDSTPHLIDMGVLPRPTTTRDPQPFPNRYVPDPPH